MFRAAEAWPVNFGFLGKGQCGDARGLLPNRLIAGVCGLKLHEDWGTTPAAIDACLRVADEFDIQVAIHTDTLERSLASSTIPSRPSVGEPFTPITPRARAAATHRTSSRSQRLPNILPSSTNPTRPLTGEHDRRASGHAYGLPSPESAGAGRRRLRRKPDPAGDHRGRRHPTRSGRDQHDVERLAGHGAHR